MIERNNPTPLYLQVEAWAMENIKSGKWKAGLKLPSEKDMAQSLGINRITLRQGFDNLIKRGYLERVHGLGVYVRNPKTTSIYNWKVDTIMTGFHNSSIHETNLTTRVLKFEKIPTPEIFRPNFPDADTVYDIVRLRSIEDIPACIEHSWMPSMYLPNITASDLEKSKYELVRACGLEFSHIDRVICPIIPSAEEKNILKLASRDVCLRIDGVSYLKGQKALEYSESLYNANIFNFTLTVYE